MKTKLIVALVILGLGLGARADKAASSGKRVLIVVGLAGDVEHAKRYEDELKTVLELLSVEGAKPSRVDVLVDEPAQVTLPAGLVGEVKAGSRENFLAYAASLRGAKEPLVVFAWGHGGLQKNIPVFHLRGPRLNAADFKTLGDAASGAGPSQWFLFFRGSGSFAKELRGDGREILSTEGEVAFASDPIGFGLLLQAWRKAPATGIGELARELGSATAAWYQSQNLARTEEPTFWAGAEAPKLLAQQATGAAGGDAGKAAGTPGAGLMQAPVSAVWAKLPLVDAAKFAGSDAVLLRRDVCYVLGDDPALSQEHDEFIQILTEAGKHYGDFDVAYSPPAEDVTFMELEVRRPDGSIEQLDPSAIREAKSQELPGYETAHRKIFSLPHVSAGAVLHVHYRNVSKRFPLPHISLEIGLGAGIPVVEENIEVRVSRKAALHFAFRGGAARDPQIEQSSVDSIYRWRFVNQPARLQELLAPPGGGPALMLSTFPDWADFAGWYGRLIRESDNVTPALAAKARELTKDSRTPREKVEAVYNFVTGLRYVAVPLGVNSHRPHAAANVLENSYGDCKDKANLFNVLLRSQGIEAWLVLVPRFAQADESVPGLAFNHAISKVQLGKETLWIDTTDDTCRFGLLPPGDAGRKVLVIDGKTTALTVLPAPQAEAHALELTTTLRWQAAGAFAGELAAVTSGYCDYALRAAANGAQAYPTTRPALSALLSPVSGVFAMEQQRNSPVAALAEAFTWSGRGRMNGLLSSWPGGGSRALVRAPFWLPGEWEAAAHPRKAPLYLNQGYPMRLKQTVRIEGVPGKIEIPVKKESKEGPLRWQVSWEQNAGGELSASATIELLSGELNAAQTLEFQRQFGELYSALQLPAVAGE